MADFQTIVETDDPSEARILVIALKAHGFHPLEGESDGLPGMPGVRGARGMVGVRVPADEAEDARDLAEALLKDMRA